jgi:hypothetical protein
VALALLALAIAASPRTGAASGHWSAASAVTLRLEPFEVKVWDLQPE